MPDPRLILVALSLLVATGCRSRSDLVEAELRTRDRELREARGRLCQTEMVNQALENTLRDQRCTQPVMRPNIGTQIKDIQIGRGTGGVDEDRMPGDEGLQVVVVPRDSDDSPIKAAGTMRITAIEITPEGLKSPLSTWDVSALQLRRSWKSGLLSTGYVLTMPWQRPPSNEKLRIVATFMPLEGGVFEAERDITVKLLAEAERGPCPILPPAGLGPPLPAPPTEGLPAPTPINKNVPTGPPPRTTTPATGAESSKPWQPEF